MSNGMKPFGKDWALTAAVGAFATGLALIVGMLLGEEAWSTGEFAGGVGSVIMGILFVWRWMRTPPDCVEKVIQSGKSTPAPGRPPSRIIDPRIEHDDHTTFDPTSGWRGKGGHATIGLLGAMALAGLLLLTSALAPSCDRLRGSLPGVATCAAGCVVECSASPKVGDCAGKCALTCGLSWITGLISQSAGLTSLEAPGDLPEPGTELVVPVAAQDGSTVLLRMSSTWWPMPAKDSPGAYLVRLTDGYGQSPLVPLSRKLRPYCASPPPAAGEPLPAVPGRAPADLGEFGPLPVW